MKTARELMLERSKIHTNEIETKLARKGLNSEKIVELRLAVANGEVDPGPPVDHADDPPTEDNRDKRDPSQLGKEFLARHNGFHDLEPKQIATATILNAGVARCHICGEIMLEDERHLHTTKESIVMQFNEGRCENCGEDLIEEPYVGGDHDPIASCNHCGKHYGCSACDFGRNTP